MRQTLKDVLKAFMRFPRTSDREIARTVGVSQPTITRCRHHLEDHGILSFHAVPGLDKIGYEIVAVNTIEIQSDEDRRTLKADKRVVFAVDVEMRPETACVVSIHKNYSSYHELISKFHVPHKTILLEAAKKPIKPFSFKDLPL